MAKEYLEAGKIVALHGVRGEMRVQPWSDDASFLKGFDTVYLDANGREARTLLSARAHGNITLIRLAGVESAEQAEALRGRILFIKKTDAVLPKGTYFVEDIIGLKALDEADGSLLGTVSEIEHYPANDVWHIKHATGETLIPNIPSIVKEIHPEEGFVRIFKMKGLFEDED